MIAGILVLRKGAGYINAPLFFCRQDIRPVRAVRLLKNVREKFAGGCVAMGGFFSQGRDQN